MTTTQLIEKKFNYLGKELLDEIIESADINTFPPQTPLVREGQYVKVVPIVISGLVKVFTHVDEKELLLYYIQPEQSCIMSFSSCINHDTSKIVAITEEESTLLLLPSDKITQWIIEFPQINKLFYQQYDLRYAELIETINHLLYYKLDKRIIDYLKEKIKLTGKNPIKLAHKDIAQELGTAREVVSRIIKKLEKQQLLKQHHDSIELF